EVACWGGRVLNSGSKEFGPINQPILIAGISDATSVAVGQSQFCAVRRTGAVSCWGDGIDGDTEADVVSVPGIFRTPTDGPGISDEVAVASGRFHACALRRTGAVVCWGGGLAGVLGDGGGESFTATPVTVANLTNAVALAGAHDHMCAVRGDADGSVVCW